MIVLLVQDSNLKLISGLLPNYIHRSLRVEINVETLKVDGPLPDLALVNVLFQIERSYNLSAI